MAHYKWVIVYAFLVSVCKSYGAAVRNLRLADHDAACHDGTRPAIVNGTSTFILSHDYDGQSKYPKNAFCMWQLVAPPGKAIELIVEEFSLQSSFECNTDFVSVYDVGNFTLPLSEAPTPLYKWCGRAAPSEVIFTGSVNVVFRSNDRVELTGFVMLYRLIDRPTEEKCASGELRCRNKRCVSSASKCDHVDDCGDGTDEEKCGFPLQKSLNCGEPSVRPVLPDSAEDVYIVGGRNVRPDSWPWQASLALRGGTIRDHKCGATVINEQWLLSAAHCFRSWSDPSDWMVYVGKTYLMEQEPAEQLRYVEDVFVHPGYQMELFSDSLKNRKDHDVALLRLNAPLTLNKHVQPVCVEEIPDLKAGTRCYITGWGKTKDSEKSLILQQGAVSIFSLEDCIKFYNGTFVVNHLMYCAGYVDGRVDACQGDSGGPLVVNLSAKWFLAGIVSSGLDCGAPEQPGIYSKISPHYRWIQNTIANSSFNSEK
ncbi:transmembrane protease serine 9-like isoform X2 [Ornithodoros turicata]|uniref:transmembrane protease serine 9-like isoform X2 n=1 Tax=Ornithodoros turicata TaxID=34597 RepID=UPI003138A045